MIADDDRIIYTLTGLYLEVIPYPLINSDPSFVIFAWHPVFLGSQNLLFVYKVQSVCPLTLIQAGIRESKVPILWVILGEKHILFIVWIWCYRMTPLKSVVIRNFLVFTFLSSSTRAATKTSSNVGRDGEMGGVGQFWLFFLTNKVRDMVKKTLVI